MKKYYGWQCKLKSFNIEITHTFFGTSHQVAWDMEMRLQDVTDEKSIKYFCFEPREATEEEIKELKQILESV